MSEETISLGVWGRSPCEPGAFEGVRNPSEIAKRIAQRKWTHGESPLITRADVTAAQK